MGYQTVKTYSILVVEDEPEVGELVVEALRSEELFEKVVRASDGNEAFYKIGNQEFDLIITDIKMPKVDGVSFINAIKKTKKHKDTKILVMSGMLTKDIAAKLIHLGATDIIVKPFSFGDILVKTKSILNIV